MRPGFPRAVMPACALWVSLAVIPTCAAQAGGAAGARLDKPTFDCRRAEGRVETLICADGGLARMDRELDRVFRLAATGPHGTNQRRAELR